MPVSKADLILYQGDDFAATVAVSNEDGTPADISTCTAQAQIRRAVADRDPVIVAEITAAVDTSTVTLSIPHTVTETLSGRYTWDLQLTSGAGQITTILAGNVQVTLEVTRPAA